MAVSDLTNVSTRELLARWAQSLGELRDRGIVTTFNNPIGDIAEALVAARFDGERGSFSQKTWEVRTSTELLQVKAIRRVSPGGLGNLSPVRSDDGYEAIIAVIFTEDLRVERTLRIPRETVNRLCPFNKHVNGCPSRLTAQLLQYPTTPLFVQHDNSAARRAARSQWLVKAAAPGLFNRRRWRTIQPAR